MELIKLTSQMKKNSENIHRENKTIGFIPTMGALHKGHLSLIDIAKKNADIMVLSIYLNPRQFSASEDINSYPKNLEKDLELAKQSGVDIVFCPDDNQIYPSNFQTYVETIKLSKDLCGKSRENHFRGVTTIVLKLFNIVRPDIAVFGKKDYQQLKIIKQMTSDLNLDVKIIEAPIIREKDGLAMSSRNIYLNAEERQAAKSLYKAIQKTLSAIKEGEDRIENLILSAQNEIESTKIGKVDYIKICDPDTLEELTTLKLPSLLAIAAYFGKARLIDNSILDI